MELSIIIPVKNPKNLKKFIEENIQFFKKTEVIVIDTSGGEDLQPIASEYLKLDCSLWDARRIGYNKAKRSFILNLDSDVIIPKGYIRKAFNLFQKDKKLGAVSIFFEDSRHHGILEFGISLWRSDLLKELYDYSPQQFGNQPIIQLGPRHFIQLEFPYCECLYMWKKLEAKGFSLQTLPFKAKHLKGIENGH